MSENKLFSDFQHISAKQWKQQIQFDLKGADYNETLIWESPEGIKVKPFYNAEDIENTNLTTNTNAAAFKILQNIFVYDVAKSNKRAQETLTRGAESIRFTITNETVSISNLMENLPLQNHRYYFNLLFLSVDFVKTILEFGMKNNADFVVQNDPIHHFITDGNWFENIDKDFEKLNSISIINNNSATISCNATIYQNAGATIVQQLAYTLAHINEYFNRIANLNQTITIEIAIGTNYFFEIAKIRSLRLLFNTLAKEYGAAIDCHIIAIPSKRNKTIYDYNTNMLRTTTECMSAILGGANAVANRPYDNLYHKDNEFGDRIARNQLLILKEESYFDKVTNPADGSYYIETLTEQLSQKALLLFKEIELKGGFISQVIEGTVQKKIQESAQKEQDLFDSGKEILLGTNKHPNKDDQMKHDLELYPFLKHNPRKTSIVPILEKRLAEKIEQERLALEK